MKQNIVSNTPNGKQKAGGILSAPSLQEELLSLACLSLTHSTPWDSDAGCLLPTLWGQGLGPEEK